MTPSQAKIEIKRLFKEGKNYSDIAAHLKKEGYVGRRGPLTSNGVSLMARKAGMRRRLRSPEKASKNARGGGVKIIGSVKHPYA